MVESVSMIGDRVAVNLEFEASRARCSARSRCAEKGAPFLKAFQLVFAQRVRRKEPSQFPAKGDEKVVKP
jgi:hypothetical protein